MHVTNVGGPTVLLELAGWRILTDPTFDPPGRTYKFGPGTSSRKTVGPAVSLADLGEIDLVLLSHDHHADNLDDAGRAVLASARTVLTTRSGSRRIRHPHVIGLAPWTRTTITAPHRSDRPERPDLVITATPARHGPPLSRPLVGQVVGFVIESPAPAVPTTWMTGDSVMYRGLRSVAKAFDIDVVLLHLGGVGFPLTGPVRYSMTGSSGLRLVQLLDPRVVVPVHYDGWSHFRDSSAALPRAFDQLPESLRSRVVWPRPGRATIWTRWLNSQPIARRANRQHRESPWV